MVEADTREFRERDRKDREVNAGNSKTEREEADHRANCACDKKCRNDADPWAHAEFHVERGRHVCAEANIKCVAERKLAREAHHDVPTLTGIGKIKNRYQHDDQIVVRDEGRGGECREKKCEQKQRVA